MFSYQVDLKLPGIPIKIVMEAIQQATGRSVFVLILSYQMINCIKF